MRKIFFITTGLYIFLLGQIHGVTFTEDTNIWDGHYGFITVADNAAVHMYGGTASNFKIIDNGEFYLHEGRLVTGIDGGSIIGYVENNAKYYQYGGSNYSLRLTENAESYFYGGTLEYVRLYNSSIVFLYGEIAKLTAYEYSQAHVYGYDFQYTQSNQQNPDLPLGYTWSNLRIFKNIQLTEYYDIKLMDHLPTTNVPFEWRTISRVQCHVIPEPCTISLVALGGIMILKRRK